MNPKGLFLFLLLITSALVPFGLADAYAQNLKISNSGDAKSPVVILFKNTAKDNLDLIKANGGEITRTYKIINGLAANLPDHAIEKLKNNPSILSIDPDIEFKAIEMDANNRIGASSIWTHPTSPATGAGINVAILDTGIDKNHQEFDSSRIILCKSEMGSKEPTCNDLNGHGTHVAGIIGAKGYQSAAKGVAPQVNYLIDKVLDKNGSGSLSGIIAGIDWAVANNADVISMSLGTSPYSNQAASNCDTWYASMTSAVNNAVSNGVVVVAAAGNSGASGVGLPACISSAIAVAAVDDSDNIASFSSLGGAVKDHGISAPGVSIFSSLPGNTYASWSGTSMATPVVTGSIALLLQENPNLTPSQVKNALFTTTCKSTTTPACTYITGTPNTAYGYGRINALAAFNSIEISGNSPPTVTITSPANGASSTSGSSVTFSATASDAQDGNISSNISWSSNIDGTIGTGSSFSKSDLSVGTHTITAAVTDSGSLTASSSITFTVNSAISNSPPTVTITSPANGASSTSGSSVTFSATASDAQDGNISSNISWSSNIDGTIGTGSSFSKSDLSVGTHTITAAVTDSGSLTASSSITFTVNPISTASEIKITCSSSAAGSFTSSCGTFSHTQTVYIKVQVLNVDTPVTGVLVTTTIDATKTDLSGQSTTDSSGIAHSTYKVNSKRDGTDTFSIYASGDGLVCNAPSSTCQIATFTVK